LNCGHRKELIAVKTIIKFPENRTLDAAVALTFDVEEHHRIEAAAHLSLPDSLRSIYTRRMDESTRWLLDLLGEHRVHATFFVVGQIAQSHPQLIRRMIRDGHEVASHSWEHRRVHHFTSRQFLDDVRASKDALEQAGGAPVVGFRAPTFSITRETSWAIDVLCEAGIRYDSSIFPVHHDRYGVPDAPRSPFMVRGHEHELLEFPLLTLRLFGCNLPVAGGGYFRLFPLALMKRGIRQSTGRPNSTAMLYFHPWEFDPDQPRLPLARLSKFRTYVGIARSRQRLQHLVSEFQFTRVVDVMTRLDDVKTLLPSFPLPISEFPNQPARSLESPTTPTPPPARRAG
jgi:polysaccharide deacetylase family protein (PEP-CTERM system associated)